MIRSIFRYITSHKRNTVILLIILIALGVVFRPKHTMQIDTQVIKRGNITQTISDSGSIDSETSVNLNFLAGGKLVYLGAKQGDSVKKGQTIASLDQQTIEKNLQSALIDYAKERNTYDQTIANNGNIASPQNATNDAMRRVLEDNQDDLNKAVISVQLEDLARQQSVLTTPIDGVVTRADVDTTGVNVSPTTTFTVADPNNLVFKVDVDEADIGQVSVGQTMEVTLDSFPNQTLHLPITQIDFASHSTSTGGTAYTVEAKLSGDNLMRYRIGMQGDADIIIAQREDVITVPLSSIVDDSYVYVKQDKKFMKKKISTGLKNDTDAAVTSGLNEGDIVAIEPDQIDKTLKQ